MEGPQTPTKADFLSPLNIKERRISPPGRGQGIDIQTKLPPGYQPGAEDPRQGQRLTCVVFSDDVTHMLI